MTIYGTTGHRDIRETAASSIAIRFMSIMKAGDTLIAGGARGWDSIITQLAVIKDVKLWLYLPFGVNSTKESFRKYAEIIKISNLARGKYNLANFFIRNQWIVDDCDILIPYWDGRKKGGTYDTIKRAKKAGKDIVGISEDWID